MSSFPILDLIAGLIFIYFLLALVNNSFIELFSAFMQIRAKLLERWIRKMLGAMANEVMDHDLLNGLSKSKKSTHYMDSKSFAKVLVEKILTPSKIDQAKPLALPDKINLDEYIQNSGLPDGIKTMLRNFVVRTHAQKLVDDKVNDISHLELQIQQWFDSSMVLLTGTYKRKTIWFTFLFASVLTVTLNIDSLQLAAYLYSNPEARQKLAASAYHAAQDSSYIQLAEKIKQKAVAAKADSTQLKKDLTDFVKEVNEQRAFMETTVATVSSSIPIGWQETSRKPGEAWWWYALRKLGGLLITTLAICLGAPFWFDVLNKVANLRSSLKPDDKKK
ncbi:MAG: hypothetical protein ACK5RG_22150 [Cyclobacteriaceae bacterium]|jgi:hypothetical protein